MMVGILLAAGRGQRFGGDKLLARLPDGQRVGEAAAHNLLAAVDRVVAVTRPGDAAVADMMLAAGCEVVVCARADEGMGASLACGVSATREADGWLIALADMPAIESATSRAVAAALTAGAPVVMPAVDTGDGKAVRGHPVGFAARFGPELLALAGDEGAKRIVRAHRREAVAVATTDRGILRDIDTLADLPREIDPE